MLREYEQCKRHLEEELDEFQRCIEKYPTLKYNERPVEYSVIQNKHRTIECDIKEMMDFAVTWNTDLRSEANEFTNRIKMKLNELYFEFNNDINESNRERLLGGHKTEIDNSKAADILIDDVNEAKATGLTLLDELGKQKSTINRISGNLTEMDITLDEGESLLNEMECRGRQRKMFLYGVYVFLFITFCVFIYYILN